MLYPDHTEKFVSFAAHDFMKPHHEKFVSGPSLVPTMNVSKRMKIGAWDFQSGAGAYYASSDASLFSSSVPVLPHEKLMISDRDQGHESTDNAAGNFDKNHQNFDDSFENIAEQTMRFLLPDNEEELLADLIDYGLRNMPSQLESEDTDLFDSLGGMELETDAQVSLGMGMSKLNLADGAVGNGEIQYGQLNSVGNVVGEHPYGEHPSRTLFVRNIHSNVEDLELKNLFEQFGDVRALYTACKHRGFVMISYYDIRDARVAMRALQNKPLRRRKLDIHFSIPKDNPSEKDLNQGTLVVFNLDPSVSNEDLLQIFGAYGEVKEIRETPHKRHHKFIEFYDVRAAEAALRALNRSDLAGKRIKLEPSRPSGTRRNFMQQVNQEPELDDESLTLRQHVGSLIANSPLSTWAPHSPVQSFSKSPGYTGLSPATSSLPGLASVLQTPPTNAMKPIGKDTARSSHVGLQSSFHHQSHPFRELNLGPYSSNISAGAATSNGSDIDSLSGPQFLWGSPSTHPEKPKNGWVNSTGGHSLTSNSGGNGHGFPHSMRQHTSFVSSPQHHHVGSAPSGIYLERKFGFFPESSPETSLLKAGSFGGMNIRPSNSSYVMNVGPRAPMHGSIPGHISDHGSPSFRMMSSPRLIPAFLPHGSYSELTLNGGETERGRSRRVESVMYQTDVKKQFLLDLDKIANGEDSRTTLMIKNIPNKYTSKMLLAVIDETHKGTINATWDMHLSTCYLLYI